MKQVKIYSGYEDWSDLDILTAVILGEAGGEKRAGQVSVGLTVRTRVKNPAWWGGTWREVMLGRSQFSCWMFEKVRIADAKASQTTEWKDCRSVAGLFLPEESGKPEVSDFLGNPTHYHAKGIYPSWPMKDGMKFLGQVGGHLFFSDVKTLRGVAK